ncbi:hypothetical protein B566_EDAN010463 [Ephemera danica]|nr:hypothetical protein B566_EDAN010463 [Ephemera danica]
MEDLSDQPDEHKLLHEALSSLEFTTVCRLIRSGMKLCYLEEENCFALIVKHWTSLYLNSALKLCPSAVNCRGPNGDTLLMLCETPEKFQTVLDHEPNVNATNNDGENVLLYNIKHRLGQVVQNILKHLYMAVPSEESVYDFMIFNLQNVEDQIKEFFKLILNSGVDVEAEDNEGQSAFQLLLKMFKTGYVMKSRLVESIFINPTHKKTTFFYQNKILSSLVSILLEVGAKLPPPDEHGRTPLMLACKSTFNLENIRTLIVRGVDINAVDAGGKNAIFHVLKSIVKYVKHPRWGISLDEKPKVGKRRLCSLPSPALLYTLYFKLRYPLYQRGVSDEDSLINDLQGKYQAIEDIQKLLLAFWQLPPLALLLFDDRHHFCDVSVVGILLRKRLMQFLYEVGGPLSPGSKICHAVQKSLVTTKRGSACDQECPFREELLPLFDQLHSEVPSLLHLSRTALRSCLKKTDTRGLDVSSLRVLCQGKMGPIPPDIVDIINFKKASVSQMKVVPDMINYF